MTAEPAFSADIISGKIDAARENKVDPSVQTATSVYQIGQISRGEEIADLSNQETAEQTLKYALGQMQSPKHEEDKPYKQ